MKDSPTWFTRWKTFLCPALIAALTVVAGQTRGGTCTPPPAGLVGWWKGDGNTTESVSGNSGVNQNVAYTNGIVDQAFSFDPENYPFGTYTGVQIPDQSAYALTNSLTIEGWVRPRGDGYIVFWRGDNRPGMDPYYLSMHGDSSHAIDFGITDAAGNNAFVETTLNYFTWTHLAATLDGDSGTLSIYTNGVLAAQTNTTVRPFGNLIPEDSPGVSIGNLNDGGNNFPFYGDVDEISLYSRALSPGEIQAIYNAGSAGKCTTNESTNNCIPPPSDLAGWWPAEGNASDVVNGNNGTLIGGASFAPGKVGLGFHLDGTNSYVQIPDSAALKPTNVTCEAWVWLDPSLPSNNGGEQIVFKKNTWTAWFEGYSLLKGTIDNGNGTYVDRFQFCVSRYGNQVAINSQTIAQRGVWYHVAGTYDGNQSKLYVNGVLEASATPGFPLDYDTTPIFIGTSGTWAPYLSMFGGIIDEASIYSRALSSNEIQAIYNAGSAGKCTASYQAANFLLNVDFGVGNGRGYSLKTGVAAVGLATNDFWNYYDRNASSDPYDWRYSGAMQNLQTADGLTTSAGMSVSDAPGGYGTSSSDPMYAIYDYPLDGGNNIVTFTNLPPGNYDILAYSADGNYEVTVGTTSYGVKTTYDPSPTGVPVWTEGVQYARWNDVSVAAGQSLALTVRNGTGGYAILSGIQLLSSQQTGVPVISGFSPAVGANNTVVTISGNHFGALPSDNIVYFGAVRANVLAATSTSLMVTVPTGSTYAPITVTVNGMTAYSDAPFEPTFAGSGAAIDSSTFDVGFNLPTPNGPYRTAIADLDGDGRPDVVVVGGTVGMISIYQNIGSNGTLNSSTFAAPILIPVGTNSSAAGLAVADVNGDGKLDLVVSDNIGNQIAIFINQSSVGPLTINSFTAPVYLPTGTDPRQMVVRDLDGDGFSDIICANVGAGTVSIFRNLGVTGLITSNSYAPRVDLVLAGNSESMAVGDLDGDGKPDLALADESGGFISLFRNHCTPGNISSSTFDTRVDLPAQSGSVNVVIGDLDGDGKPELLTSAYLPQTMSVYRNLSTPGSLTINSFAAPVDYGLAGRGHNIALADFNGDGKPDVAEVTELASALSLFQNIGTGSFNNTSLAARVDFATGWNAWGIAVGDLDGDGRPDAVFANTYDSTITIYHNQMPLAISPSSTNPPAITVIVPNVAVPGTIITISGTNFSPFAASNIVYFGAVRATVFLSSPTNLVVTVPTGATFAPITVTVNGLTAYGPQPFEPTFPGAGQIDDSSLAPFVNLPTGNGPGQVVIADLDGDGKPDLIIPDSYAGEVSIYQNISTNGSLTAGSFAPRVVLPMLPTSGTNPYRVVAADLDGDGRLDLIVLNPDSNVISILRNISSPGIITTNSFDARIDLPGGNVIRGLAVQDLNGDGKPEIVTGNNGDNAISVFQNLSTFGNIAFAVRVDFPAGNGASSVAIGDLDGDGIPDLAVANINDGTISVLRNTGLGGNISTSSFAPKVDFPALATPFPIVIGDVDGDGKMDLVVGGSMSSQAISVYRNTSTAGSITTDSFAPHVDFAAPGWVNSIALADLDGDGRLDIALGSQLSSVFSIFKNVSQPGGFTTMSLAARVDYSAGYNPNGVTIGDLDGDGQPDIVFANSYDNNIYIYRNLVPLATAPVITSQPTNLNVAVGTMVTFNFTVQGAFPLSYQWSFNGTNIGGATNVTLTLTNVQLSQAGNYAVLVSNLAGSAASSNAVLTIYVPAIPPAIVSQTPNQVVLLGHTATFDVTASGSNPLSYFWLRNDVLIPGATNASYSLPNAQLADSGSQFYCLVTNAYGVASSTNVTLKVIDTIANDLCSGAIVISNGSYTNVQSTLKASSFGDPVPDCVNGFGHGVWYQFTAPVDGRLIVDTLGSDFDTGLAVYTGSRDALTEVACNDDFGGVTSQVNFPTTAETTYFILVGGYGSDAGNLVLHLNHQTPPAFAVQPVDESIIVNSNASFNAVVTGALPMSFQWYFGATPLTDDGRISGSTTASLSISNITTADAGSYSLAVTNFLGSTNSMSAVLTVLVPPSITLNPIGRSVPSGLPTTFNATATGNPAPDYQWQWNGMNIPGATNSSYAIAAMGTNDLGFYHLVASNSVGLAVSANAQLTFGPVAAWGRNLDNECLPPPGLSNVIAVAGNFGASFAVGANGTIVPWGVQVNIPLSASNVVAVTTSDPGQNYALRADGTVVGWPVIAAPVLSNIVSIAAGYDFAYALRAEGTLTNIYLGKNIRFSAGLNHVTAIACGYSSAMALRSDGTVVMAGLDGITNPPAGLNNVTAIAAGYSYAMALKTNGTVVAWGSGSGTNLPAGMTNIVAISAGNYPSENSGLAIRADGSVLAWGDNNFGEKFPPAALSNLSSVAISTPAYHGLAVVNNGCPVILHPPVGLTAYTGRDVTLQGSAAGAQPLSYQWLFNGANIPGATNNVLAIPNLQSGNAGNYQLFVSNTIGTALSLAAPLTVVSNNILTFLSQPPTSQTNYQGSKTTLGVTVLGSGPVNYQWSYSTNIQTFFTAIPGATNDTLVFDPALAGQSGYYRVVASNKFSTVTSSSTYLRVLFAKSWGYLAKDPPFDVTNAIAIAAGNSQSGGHYLALKSDGKISSWSGSFAQYGETNVSALSNSFVTAIAAGYQDSLALKSDGTLYAWGFGVYGQTNIPSGLNGITAIACGDYHDLALKADGTVAGWGQNNSQQTTNAAATNVVAIAAGGLGSMALRADGSVVTWGGYGTQPPFFVNTTNNIEIAAGAGHFLALRTNGTVIGWGNNSYGQTTIPAGISNIVAISAGANHSVLLRNDGSVITLGAYAGQTTLGAPSDLANVVAIASSGDHDLALFGTRAPAITVQPWNRAVPVNSTTNITLAAKCVGVQPVRYQWKLNGTNVPGATNDTLILTSLRFGTIVIFPTGAYQLIASNAYGVAASKFAKVTTFYPLANALDTDTPRDPKSGSLYNWTTSGNAQWFGETNITHDGVDAVQSGGIGALQESILQTTVGTNWSGTYTFWWKVSSEEDFDFLEFRVNGITQASISGLSDWQPASIHVDAYTNVLQWRYSKDATFDAGLDAGWVDQFAFVPDPPKITVQPVNQTVNMGANVKLMVTATGPNSLLVGGPAGSTLRYQWRQNGQNIGGSSSLAFLTLNNVGRAQDGTYSVTVTNFSLPNNSIVSSNAVLKVLVPQLLGSPVLLPDGSFQLTSTDANGGLLSPSDLANFEAQASTNLVDWVTLPNALSLTNGMLMLQDGGQSNYATRFYRLLEH